MLIITTMSTTRHSLASGGLWATVRIKRQLSRKMPNTPNANMAVQQFFVWTGSQEKKSN